MGTLIALHGHGDDADSALAWAAAVAPPGWQVRTPVAPVDETGQRSWFDTGPRGVDEASLRRSLDALAAEVASVGDRPVVLAGFSQGAALALAVGAGVGVDAVVAFSGFLAEVDGTLPDGPPALVLAGAADEVVPAFLSEDAAAALAQQGREVVTEVLPGGHEVSDVAARRAAAWLADRWPGRLRVSVVMPTDRVGAGAELVSGDAVAELAAGYERLGYDATYVTDHPAPDDRWLAGGGHHALEPTVVLMAAAAATRTLRLHTHIYVPAYRNPFLAAKAVASLDVLSGGRVILGVAAGYLRPEFRALGMDFDRRGALLDEALELLPRIWAEDAVAVEGDGFSSRGVTALPRPLQRPHPPMWVGGNSAAAMRRAVLAAQGWAPFPTPGGLEKAARTARIADVEDLRAALGRARRVAEEAGRAMPTICFAMFSLEDWVGQGASASSVAASTVGATTGATVGARVAEEAEELRSLGVDWVTVNVPGLGRAEVLERAEELAGWLGLSSR